MPLDLHVDAAFCCTTLSSFCDSAVDALELAGRLNRSRKAEKFKRSDATAAAGLQRYVPAARSLPDDEQVSDTAFCRAIVEKENPRSRAITEIDGTLGVLL